MRRASYGWQACLLRGIYFYRPESRFKRCFDDLWVKFSLLFNRFKTLFLVNSRIFLKMRIRIYGTKIICDSFIWYYKAYRYNCSLAILIVFYIYRGL